TTAGGTIFLSHGSGLNLRHLFVVRIEGGKGAYRYIPELKPGDRMANVIPSMDGAQPIQEFSEAIGHKMAARLTECGLYSKEARAMVNTWRSSYFQTDGIRILYVLPQSW